MLSKSEEYNIYKEFIKKNYSPQSANHNSNSISSNEIKNFKVMDYLTNSNSSKDTNNINKNSCDLQNEKVINKYKYYLKDEFNDTYNNVHKPNEIHEANKSCHLILNTNNFYQVLGIKENAHESEIRNAYKTKSFEFYPQINPSLMAYEAFAKISLAFQSLTKSYKFSLTENNRNKETMIQPEKCFIMFLKCLKNKKYLKLLENYSNDVVNNIDKGEKLINSKIEAGKVYNIKMLNTLCSKKDNFNFNKTQPPGIINKNSNNTNTNRIINYSTNIRSKSKIICTKSLKKKIVKVLTKLFPILLVLFYLAYNGMLYNFNYNYRFTCDKKFKNKIYYNSSVKKYYYCVSNTFKLKYDRYSITDKLNYNDDILKKYIQELNNQCNIKLALKNKLEQKLINLHSKNTVYINTIEKEILKIDLSSCNKLSNIKEDLF